MMCFMSKRLNTLTAYRDVIEEAYFSGILTVTFDGTTTTFQKSAEMRIALSDLNRKIEALEGTTSRPRVAQIDLGGF